MEPYKSLYPNAYVLLPETERSAARIIIFPTGQTVTPGIIEKICASMQRAFADAPRVKARLAKTASTS
jgi:dTDP-4-amino-4,6-dideoxygalactose transaminase